MNIQSPIVVLQLVLALAISLAVRDEKIEKSASTPVAAVMHKSTLIDSDSLKGIVLRLTGRTSQPGPYRLTTHYPKSLQSPPREKGSLQIVHVTWGDGAMMILWVSPDDGAMEFAQRK